MGQLAFDRIRSTANATRRPRELPGEQLIREQDTPTGTSFTQGVGITNDFAIADRALNEWTRDRGEEDPDLQPGTLLQNDPERSWILRAANDDADLFDALHGARNEEDLMSIADNYRERAEAFTQAYDNTWAGVAGNIVGIMLSPSTYLPTVALKGGQAIGITAKAAHNARRAAMLKLALLEGASQTAIGALESVGDPSFGAAEIAIQGGFGAAAGGAVGFAFPKAALLEDLGAAPRAAKGFDRAADAGEAAADVAEIQPKPLSAAASEEAAPGAHAPKDAQSAFVQSGRTFGPDFFRSSKQQVENWLATHGQGDTRGAVATRKFGDLMGAIWRYDQPTAGEIAGTTVRGKNVEEFKEIELRQRIKGTMDAKVRGAYNKMIEANPVMAKRGMNRVVSVTPGPVKRWYKQPITRGEFDQFTGKMMRLMEHSRMDADQAAARVLEIHGPELALEAKPAVIQAMKEASQARISAFREVGEMAVEAGLDEDGLIARSLENPAYLTQAYDVGRVLQFEDQLIDRLLRSWGQRPPQQAIDEFLGTFGDEAGDVTAGTKWDDLDLETREDIEQWLWANKGEELIAEAEKEVGRLNKLLKKGKKTRTVEELSVERDKIKVKVDRQMDKLRQKQDDPRSVGEPEKKIYQDLADLEEAYNTLDDLIKEVQSKKLKLADIEARIKASKKASNNPRVQKALKQVQAVSKGTKKPVKAAEAKVSKIAEQAESLDLRMLATSMIKNISRSLDEGQSAFGFNMMGDIGATGKAGRMHPRQIDWGDILEEGDDILDYSLINDPNELFENYIETVGTRIGMVKSLGTAEPTDLIKDIIDDMPADIRGAAGDIVNAMLDRALGRHHLKGTGQYEGLRWGSQVLKNLNVAAMLGTATFTLSGDIGVTHLSRELAQGATGSTIRDFFRLMKPGRNVRNIMDSLIAMEQNELAALVVGARNIANFSSRQQRLLDVERMVRGRGVGKPGTLLWKTTRAAQTGSRFASEAMMDLNLMNHWNARWSHMLRMAHIANLETLARKGFSNLDESMQATLRSAGIDEAGLERMAAAYKKPKVKIGDAQLPDLEQWTKAEKAALTRWVETRSMNGIIAPGLGDMPNFANDPLGSLMFQFQGFPFSAQQKVVRRMQQKGYHDTLVQQSLTFMLFASALGMGARHVATGQPEKLDFSDPRNLVQFMYDMVLRSPISVAGAGMWSELFTSTMGRPINTAIGAEVVPQPGRLRERQILEIILGPGAATGSNLLNAIPEIGSDLAKGDLSGAGDRAVQTLPLISSHFLWRAIDNSLED